MTQHPTVGLDTAAQPPRTAPTGVLQVVHLEAVEHHWEPCPGKVLSGYAYNAQVPGPVIEATVGDTLLVRFTNRLPTPTAIRWHGVRGAVTAHADDPAAPVPPGDSVEYRVELPDAGSFAYQAHPHEPAQQSGGLYGAVVVRDPMQPRLEERVLVFREVELDLAENHRTTRAVRQSRCGHQRLLLLVNGICEPQLQIPAGHVERWRLVNASSARYLDLSLNGDRFHILGTGGGLIAAPHPATNLEMAPGDRYDLAVGPCPDGATLVLETLPRGHGDEATPRATLATLRATHTDGGDGTRADDTVDPSSFRRDIKPLVSLGAEPTRSVRYGEGRARPGARASIGGRPRFDDAPARVGELQVWELHNDSARAGLFRLHGFFFQVLDIDGAPPPYLSWEGSVTVPTHGRVRIAWLPDRPGRWSYSWRTPQRNAAEGIVRFEVVPKRPAASSDT